MWGIFCRILSVPHNTAMGPNNIMLGAWVLSSTQFILHVVSLYYHAKGLWKNVLSLFGFINLLTRSRPRCDSPSLLTTKLGERQSLHTSVFFIHPTLKHCNSTFK